jgi:hypothetical protein
MTCRRYVFDLIIYLSSRFGAVTNRLCVQLLTIVMNGFYEGLVQLIDRLVEFALEHMRFSGRTSLVVEDFSFGYGQYL